MEIPTRLAWCLAWLKVQRELLHLEPDEESSDQQPDPPSAVWYNFRGDALYSPSDLIDLRSSRSLRSYHQSDEDESLLEFQETWHYHTEQLLKDPVFNPLEAQEGDEDEEDEEDYEDYEDEEDDEDEDEEEHEDQDKEEHDGHDDEPQQNGG
ncbi:hypothetical protein F5B18DRAFT_646074 [Nemania serpens]|nr:hypothetical protein F5B18DRAFT_646074 [Nemania serpens]